ncbi:MAG: substrate-binding domain-containing protein [Capsulimonadaceae bacterium]|nr:substrate-binding domain-containing protein [Capsulimonadaceae bacterium]
MQVADELRRRVRSGQLRNGASLPSRRALASEFGVAVGTIQQAVGQLIDEGLLLAKSTSRTEVVGMGEALATATDAKPSAPRDNHSSPVVAITCDLKPLSAPGANIWIHTVVSSIERDLTLRNCQTRFINQYNPGNPWLNSAETVEQAINGHADAVIVVFPDASYSESALIRSAHDGLGRTERIVVVSNRTYPRPLYSAFCDDSLIGLEAAAHLIDAGCRDLLFFAAFSSRWVASRKDGAQEAANLIGGSGITFTSEVSDEPPSDAAAFAGQVEMPYLCAQRLLSQGLKHTGIIAANDACALGWMKAASERGLKAGVDYAITGADDRPEARDWDLTTFRMPLEALATAAVRLAIGPNSSNEPAASLCFYPELIVRRSSRIISLQ